MTVPVMVFGSSSIESVEPPFHARGRRARAHGSRWRSPAATRSSSSSRRSSTVRILIAPGSRLARGAGERPGYRWACASTSPTSTTPAVTEPWGIPWTMSTSSWADSSFSNKTNAVPLSCDVASQ